MYRNQLPQKDRIQEFQTFIPSLPKEKANIYTSSRKGKGKSEQVCTKEKKKPKKKKARTKTSTFFIIGSQKRFGSFHDDTKQMIA